MWNFGLFASFIFIAIFSWWIGINHGIGLAMIHGPEEACSMIRWTLLICE